MKISTYRLVHEYVLFIVCDISYGVPRGLMTLSCSIFSLADTQPQYVSYTGFINILTLKYTSYTAYVHLCRVFQCV